MPMQKILFVLMMMALALNLKATHHLTYFVYVESHFPQGYWKDADLAYDHQGVYLYPHQYTDLFGTVKVDFYQKLLDRLEEHHSFYEKVKLEENELNQEYDREACDTLQFAVQQGLSEDQMKTIRNELTATVLGAGECRAVRLNHYQGAERTGTELLDYSHLDYPLFELVSADDEQKQPETRIVEKRVHDTVYRTIRDTVFAERHSRRSTGDSRSCWDRYLWIGIILVLSGFILRSSRRTRKR